MILELFVRLPAHGVGSRQDLPLPLGYVVAGAAAALVVSSLVIGRAWRVPQLVNHGAGRPVPGRVQDLLDHPVTRWVARLAGLAVTALFVLALVAGPDGVDNPAPGMLYVWLWAGLVPASLLLGPVWRVLGLLRTVHLLLAGMLRRDPRDGFVALPERFGYWPPPSAWRRSSGWSWRPRTAPPCPCCSCGWGPTRPCT